LQLCTSAP